MPTTVFKKPPPQVPGHQRVRRGQRVQDAALRQGRPGPLRGEHHVHQQRGQLHLPLPHRLRRVQARGGLQGQGRVHRRLPGAGGGQKLCWGIFLLIKFLNIQVLSLSLSFRSLFRWKQLLGHLTIYFIFIPNYI